MAVDPGQGFVWGQGGSRLTPEDIAAQRKVAQALMMQGADYSPVQSPWQGAARMAQGLFGGYQAGEADRASKQNGAESGALRNEALAAAGITPSMGMAAPPQPAAQASPALPPGAFNPNITMETQPDLNNVKTLAVKPDAARTEMAMAAPGLSPLDGSAAAIASIESGGRYDAMGPTTKTGDRAHGKYQVMGANIGPWTEQYLGRRMTPQDFLASPEAQDAVFQGEFGRLAAKHGQVGASKAWFAGEGGMNNPSARDQLGTSVSAYGDRFAAGLAKNGGLQVASADPNFMPGGASALSPTPSGSSQFGQFDGAPTANSAPYTEVPTRRVDPVVAQMATQPQAQAAPSGRSPINPAILKLMSSPYGSDQDRKIGAMLFQHGLSADKVQTIDLGNAVGVMDARGNLVRQISKGEPNKGPEFGEVGTDPQTGEKLMGWRDPRTQNVVPYRAAPAANAAPSTLPPVPAGVDPKVWRDAQSKEAAKNGLPASFDDTAKLRNEFTALPAYKNMAQAAPVYQSMRDAAGRDTKAADLNIVYGLGKIMDPGSVVREGELVLANNAQGWQEKLNGMIAQINSKGALTPEGREALMAEAHSRISSYKSEFDRDAGRYKGITERNRINTADVIPDFGTLEPWTAPKSKVAPAQVAPVKVTTPADARKLTPGTRFMTPDGREMVR